MEYLLVYRCQHFAYILLQQLALNRWQTKRPLDTIAFERSRVNEMIRDFPKYRDQLQSIIDRMQDLIISFRRKFYRTETMQESSSLKMVLPALCPEFSYKEMEISDGKAASNAFLVLYYCQDEEYKILTRQHLLDYCNLDTLAMVKILEVLKGV